MPQFKEQEAIINVMAYKKSQISMIFLSLGREFRQEKALSRFEMVGQREILSAGF